MSFFEQADRTPVTFLVLLAYVTMAVLTDPVSPTGEQLLEHGSCSVLMVSGGEPWRMISAAFLHGGLVHLLFNGYCLLMVGPMLEQSVGSVKFVTLYVVAAIGGSIGAMLWASHPAQGCVGGSGALFGMFGAIVAMNMRGGRHLLEFLEFRGPRSILMLIAVNLVIGFLIPVVSNSAHIGGLISGFVLMFVFLDRGRYGVTDVIARVTQAGWIALFVGCAFYCTNPVGHATYVYERIRIESIPDTFWPPSDLEDAPEPILRALEHWREK